MNTGADARPQRYSAGGARPTTLAAILAVSIGANVALIAALLAVVLLARAGYFAPSPQAATGTGISATTTPAPSPSATPAAGGLQVTPTSVQLGCDSGQQYQVVVLKNSGSESMDWVVQVSGGSDQAGVSISPRHGTLRPGTSIAIRLQNTSNGDGRQGVITFNTNAQAGGSPPTLSYTTAGC